MNALTFIAGTTLALYGNHSIERPTTAQGLTTRPLTELVQTELTLRDAIRLANLRSTSVRAARANVSLAKARLGQQNSRLLPQLSFGASATRYDDVTTVNFGGLGSFELLPDHQEQLGLVLAEDIDVSGQLSSSISQARLTALSAEYLADAAIQDESLATTSTYYSVLRAQQDVAVAQATLAAYQEQLRTTTKLYEGGVGQKIDVYRAQSQVADAERELTTRQNDLSSAKSSLNDKIGRPLDQTLEIADVTPEPVGADAPENVERPLLIAKALDKRSEALAASIDVAAAQKGIRIARAGSGPTVSLSVAGYHYPSTSFQSPRENVGALTLAVSVPIFDGGLVRQQVNQAKSEVENAKAREDQTRRQISLEVQNADLDILTARTRLNSALVGLKSAQEARKLAQQRFEAQVGLYLEVTDAQAALSAAQASVVDATYDLLIARARLSRSLSEPLAP